MDLIALFLETLQVSWYLDHLASRIVQLTYKMLDRISYMEKLMEFQVEHRSQWPAGYEAKAIL